MFCDLQEEEIKPEIIEPPKEAPPPPKPEIIEPPKEPTPPPKPKEEPKKPEPKKPEPKKPETLKGMRGIGSHSILVG